jgi:hypothetical protein
MSHVKLWGWFIGLRRMAKDRDLIQFWITAKYFSSASFICCDSWVSYSGDAEELSLLKRYAVSIGKQLSTFQRTVVASSSGWNSPRRSRCIVCGATAQIGPRPPHYWGWSNKIRHTQPVRMLRSASRRGRYIHNTKNTEDEHPCPQCDSKPWSQQSSDLIPTRQTPGYLVVLVFHSCRLVSTWTLLPGINLYTEAF